MADIIILDKDGTVLDSMDATLNGFVQTMQSYVSKEQVIKTIMKYDGASPDEQYSVMLNKPRNDSLVLKCVDALWEILKTSKPKAFEDALEVIPKLASDGYVLVMSTGYRTDIAEAQLEMLGLRKYFDIVLGHRPPITKGRPHMEAIKKNYRLSSDEMKNVVIIGDGPGDMKMGRGYTKRLYGIDRLGNSQELVESGALKIFPTLVKFYRYFRS